MKRIDVLPYHRFSEGKYERLGIDYALKGIVPAQTRERTRGIRDFFLGRGFSVKVGG